MGYRNCFSEIIKKQYPVNFKSMMIDIDHTYKVIYRDIEFITSSKNPLDKRLDFSAYFLALIRVLEKQGESYDQIRDVCLNVTKEYIRPKNTLQKWLKRLPAKLINTLLSDLILSIMDKKVRRKGHFDGFEARIITDKQETYGMGYGIDIMECGICNLFNKYDAQKYVSILCEIDKLTSELAGLELVRTGTIANGASKCDFRFKKKS